jgi:hypothetical protein
MATDIVGSLFGVSPEMYQEDRNRQGMRDAIAMAQLDPMQYANAAIQAGAGRAAGGFAGLMGVEDPQMRLISQRNALAKQIDMNDPESIMRGAQMAAQSGDTVAASTLAEYARKAASDLALIQQRLRERQGVDPIQQLIRAGKHTPQSIDLYAKSGNIKDLELIEKPLAEPTTDPIKNARAIAAAEFPVGSPQYEERYREELKRLTAKEPKAGNVKEVGVAMGSREPVYLDVNQDLQFIYQKGADGKQMRVPYVGGVDRTTASTKVEAERKQTEFEKLLDKKDADRVGNAMTLQENAIASLNSLNRLNQLDQSALISGSFASGRVGATNLLNTLGLTSAKDQDVLAKSENYQKTAGDVILATLGGRLGSGFSNADREFIQSLVPQLENSPQARKQLIEFMVKKNQGIVDETTRLENYARDKKTLKGYVPTIPIVNLGANAPKPLSELSNEELMNQFNKLKAKKP